MLKEVVHEYSESDPVYFIREPIGKRIQATNCHSCATEFKNIKQMCFCEFCGHASCKDCSKKTRYFFDESQNITIDDSIIETPLNPKRPRGKICLLCVRKFMINRIYFSSFKSIDAQNLTISSQSQNTEKIMLDLTQEKNDFDYKLYNQAYELAKVEPELKAREEELQSLE